MIPKTIHYIWFGPKQKPAGVVQTIDSWRKLPEYEVCQWSEANYDISLHPWMERMFKEGKYAFASDWARLDILQKHGGIYLDTDVEIRKPLDSFLNHGMFWGFEHNCYLATCIIGSRPKHPLLEDLLREYDFCDDAPINNAVVTRFFLKRFKEFRLNNSNQIIGGDVALYGKEYFSMPSFNPRKNFSRHHGTNLWRESTRKTQVAKTVLRALLGEVIYLKLTSYLACRRNEFSPIYKQHRRLK